MRLRADPYRSQITQCKKILEKISTGNASLEVTGDAPSLRERFSCWAGFSAAARDSDRDGGRGENGATTTARRHEANGATWAYRIIRPRKRKHFACLASPISPVFFGLAALLKKVHAALSTAKIAFGESRDPPSPTQGSDPCKVRFSRKRFAAGSADT